MSSESVFSRLAQERTLFLSKEIDGQNATELSANLILLNQLDPSKEIILYINSPGGTVEDGLLTIYDTIQSITSPLKTICCGTAYSSAAVLLTAAKPGFRFAYPHAHIMIHQVSLDDISGNFSEIEREMNRVKSLNSIVMKLLSKHTNQKLSTIIKDCAQDKYFSAKEALKYGLIDGIIKNSSLYARKKSAPKGA